MSNTIISYKGVKINLVELQLVEQLVPHCIAGDRLAQFKFYKTMKPIAYNICNKYLYKNEGLLSETIQNGLHKALINLITIHESKSFYYWFCNVIKNECIDQIRKEKQEKSKFENGLLEMNETNLDIQYECYGDMEFEIEEQLKQMLIHQNPKHRKIFEMIYKGYNYLDMSEDLGLPVGSIKSVVSRCRAELRNRQFKTA